MEINNVVQISTGDEAIDFVKTLADDDCLNVNMQGGVCKRVKVADLKAALVPSDEAPAPSGNIAESLEEQAVPGLFWLQNGSNSLRQVYQKTYQIPMLAFGVSQVLETGVHECKMIRCTIFNGRGTYDGSYHPVPQVTEADLNVFCSWETNLSWSLRAELNVLQHETGIKGYAATFTVQYIRW